MHLRKASTRAQTWLKVRLILSARQLFSLIAFSRLSEASKMLRRLEKGLIQQKRKSNSSEAHAAGYGDSTHTGASDSFNNGARGDPYSSSPNTHFPSNELPPLNLPHQYSAGNDYPNSASSSRTMDMDEDDDDETEQNNDGLFPAKMIRKENQRNSFFRTILNPEDETVKGQQPRGTSYSPPQSRTPTAPPGPSDPIESGLMNEEEAKVLFDAIFIRLNPFINLFDPALHTVNYVRSKCRFLFTTLIMAGCRFFRPELFKQCQKLAHDFAVQAFAQAWKRVEVVQAFACLTYWRDPDDNVRSYILGLLARFTNFGHFSVPGLTSAMHVLSIFSGMYADCGAGLSNGRGTRPQSVCSRPAAT